MLFEMGSAGVWLMVEEWTWVLICLDGRRGYAVGCLSAVLSCFDISSENFLTASWVCS